MGIKSIMQAKKIVIVVNGKQKAQIVKEAFFGPVTPKVPASVLQLHNDVTLLGDAEALELIECQSMQNMEVKNADKKWIHFYRAISI